MFISEKDKFIFVHVPKTVRYPALAITEDIKK